MKFCGSCGRPKKKFHICDMVELSDGQTVHASRVEIGGDLHDKLGNALKVVNRWITPEMKKQMKREGIDG